MPEHVGWNVPLVLARLPGDYVLGLAARIPELSALAGGESQVRRQLGELVRQCLQRLPVLEPHRYAASPRLEEAGELRRIELELAPAAGARGGWVKPVQLRFDAVVWRQRDARWVAWSPLLDLHAWSATREELDDVIRREIRQALIRTRRGESLEQLLWLEPFADLELETLAVQIELPTARELWSNQDERQQPVLPQVATRLADRGSVEAYGRQREVRQLLESLAAPRARSLLLVGPPGVGKSAVVRELARHLPAPRALWSTSGARLVSGMTGYGQWQQRCLQLVREAPPSQVVLHLGNLVELLDVGKYEGNPLGMAAFFKPYIERGEILAITECTPSQLAVIERETPGLLDCFAQLELSEPDEQLGRLILSQWLADQLAQPAAAGPPARLPPAGRAQRERSQVGSAAVDSQSAGSPPVNLPEGLAEVVAETDRLHRRYAAYSAYPGRPLAFLRGLLPAGTSTARRPLDRSRITTSFSEQTGLPLTFLEEDLPLDLQQAEDWFSRRVLGQEDAIRTVVDLLATVKSGLTRPQRPIASLLFVGPTGVGKTETAKALAEYLYQDPGRMTRLDMSEYSDPLAVERLIGGSFQREGVLTARVREQPFGVVLLDEFEKAHPELFDLLLQVLGEGRLTDAAGRLADFSNSVLIMTSNLGAEARRGSAIGFAGDADARGEARAHYLREARQFFRPEFFNRIDRIVAFDPLPREVVRDIAARELEALGRRQGLRYRDLSLEMDEGVAHWLARQAWDPRYGARPLKRALERLLLAPLARGVNRYAADSLLQARVVIEAGDERVGDERLGVRVAGHAPAEPLQQQRLRGRLLANVATELRRQIVAARRSHAVATLENRLVRLARHEARIYRLRQLRPQDEAVLRELADVRRVAAAWEELEQEATRIEDALKLPLLDQRGGEPELESVESLGRLRPRFHREAADIFARSYESPDEVHLVLFGDPDWRAELADAYVQLGQRRGATVRRWQLVTGGAEALRGGGRRPVIHTGPVAPGQLDTGLVPLLARPQQLATRGTEAPAEASPSPPARSDAKEDDAGRAELEVGLAVSLWSPASLPLLDGEDGRHLLRNQAGESECLVEVVGRLEGYRGPANLLHPGTLPGQPLRRLYDQSRELLEDKRLEPSQRAVRWADLSGTLESLLAELLTARIFHWMGVTP